MTRHGVAVQNSGNYGVTSTTVKYRRALRATIKVQLIENKRNVGTTCLCVSSGIKSEGITDDGKASDAITNATSEEYINRREINGSDGFDDHTLSE